jgi:hypothetical protein
MSFEESSMLNYCFNYENFVFESGSLLKRSMIRDIKNSRTGDPII